MSPIAMKRLLVLLLCAFAMLSLATGPVAHAAEGTICIETTAAHAGDEGRESPDSDGSGKSVQHQHGGCHGHHFASLSNDMTVANRALLDDGNGFARAAALAGASPDPALRPPQA